MATWAQRDLANLYAEVSAVGDGVAHRLSVYPPINIDMLGTSALIALEQGAVSGQEADRVMGLHEININI